MFTIRCYIRTGKSMPVTLLVSIRPAYSQAESYGSSMCGHAMLRHEFYILELQWQRGKDATNNFEDAGHSTSTRAMVMVDPSTRSKSTYHQPTNILTTMIRHQNLLSILGLKLFDHMMHAIVPVLFVTLQP